MLAPKRSNLPVRVLESLLLSVWLLAVPLCKAEPDIASGIRVKYVVGDSVYLEAGSAAGLAQGQRLTVLRREQTGETSQALTVGEIEIESVVPASSAGRILNSNAGIMPGDTAYISQQDLHLLRRQAIETENEKYIQVVSFTAGSPPTQEIREALPKPPLPEINRIRGRIGFDTSILQTPDNDIEQYGFTLRLDATRLGGTHWNISGYHRGKIQSRTDYAHQTLTDLINRTYTLSLSYDNPHSNWVAGVGRLLIPWASSLNTMDGFYVGRRFGKETVGFFGGTNPDPTSWDYDRNRQTAGVFVNIDRGTFESSRISSTSGIAVSRIRWDPDRQFAFFENRFFYKTYFSVYSNIEADLLSRSNSDGNRKVVMSRSYLTVRFQPHKMISFDLNENYYRNIPTFDSRLIGTGLLDRYLFQGVSGGFRLSLPNRMGLFANTGRSSRTGDHRPQWNYLGGAWYGDILHSGVRAEYRLSRFDTSFGRGTYQTAILNREVGDSVRFEIQLGQQAIVSPFTAQSRARFVSGNADWYIGRSYFIGMGVTAYRGQEQDYNQYFINLSYRFDNRR